MCTPCRAKCQLYINRAELKPLAISHKFSGLGALLDQEIGLLPATLVLVFLLLYFRIINYNKRIKVVLNCVF